MIMRSRDPAGNLLARWNHEPRHNRARNREQRADQHDYPEPEDKRLSNRSLDGGVRVLTWATRNLQPGKFVLVGLNLPHSC